jgi:hypothetical protein
MTRRILCVGWLVVCSTTMAAQTPARSDGWVVLSVPDYQALRTRAFPQDRPPDPPPVDATITQIVYDLVAADDVAAGSAHMTIDVLKDGWVEVPLPQGLHVREARLGNAPLAIVDGPSPGVRRVLLSQRGRALVTLDVVVPILGRAGAEQIVLPAARSGLVSATVMLPRPDVDVAASGGLIVDKVTAPGSLRVVSHGTAGVPLGLTWHRKRDTTRGALPLKLRATVQQVVGLGEETAQITARVSADIVQGLASALVLNLPAGLTINQVQGAHVADWEVQGNQLRITLLEQVDARVTVLVTGEFRPSPAGRVDVPLLQVVDAERETGGVAVEVLGAGEVTAHEARGLDPADPSDLGDLVAGRTSPALVAYRYRGQQGASGRSLALTISRYTPQSVLLAAVDEARYRVLLTEDGKALVEARLALRNNQRSFLGVKPPVGATLWSASIDGRAIRPGAGQDDTLLLPLRKRRVGEDAPAFAVDLVYVDRQAAWSAAGDMTLTLPTLDVPVSRTGVAVRHSPRFRVTLQPGVFREQAYEPPLSMALRGGFGSGTGDGSAEGAARGAGERGQIEEQNATRDLVQRFRRDSRGARTAGVLPVSVAIPELGPLVYLAAELTPEGSAPVASFAFKRTVK